MLASRDKILLIQEWYLDLLPDHWMINSLCIKVSPQWLQCPLVTLMMKLHWIRAQENNHFYPPEPVCCPHCSCRRWSSCWCCSWSSGWTHLPPWCSHCCTCWMQTWISKLSKNFETLVLSAPDKAIVVEVDSKGIDAGDEHVQTQIKFCV